MWSTPVLLREGCCFGRSSDNRARVSTVMLQIKAISYMICSSRNLMRQSISAGLISPLFCAFPITVVACAALCSSISKRSHKVAITIPDIVKAKEKPHYVNHLMRHPSLVLVACVLFRIFYLLCPNRKTSYESHQVCSPAH